MFEWLWNSCTSWPKSTVFFVYICISERGFGSWDVPWWPWWIILSSSFVPTTHWAAPRYDLGKRQRQKAFDYVCQSVCLWPSGTYLVDDVWNKNDGNQTYYVYIVLLFFSRNWCNARWLIVESKDLFMGRPETKNYAIAIHSTTLWKQKWAFTGPPLMAGHSIMFKFRFYR